MSVGNAGRSEAEAREIDLIRQYLSGRLSEAEALRFEARVAAEPSIYKSVEEVLRLQEGLAVLEEKGELKDLLREPRWRGRRWIMAAAAVLVFAAIAVGIRLGTREHGAGVLVRSAAEIGRPSWGAGSAQIIGSYVLSRTRGESAMLEVARPSISGAIELKLVPSVSEASGRYLVELDATGGDGRGSEVARLVQVPLGPEGYVEVFVDSKALKSGTYQVVLTAPTSGASPEPDRFAFQVK